MMRGFWGWMAGKKTYLLAGTLFLVGLGLLMTGKLSPAAGMGLLLAAACGFPATIRSAIERHQKEEVTLLIQIAATGAAVGAHNLPAARQVAVQAVQDAIRLGQEIQAEAAAPSAGPAVGSELVR